MDQFGLLACGLVPAPGLGHHTAWCGFVTCVTSCVSALLQGWQEQVLVLSVTPSPDLPHISHRSLSWLWGPVPTSLTLLGREERS